MNAIRQRLVLLCAHRRSHSRSCLAPMACQRQRWSVRSGVQIVLGLVAVIVLLLQVGLSNAIVSRRQTIASLSGERDYLVTRVGELELAWHRLTDRATIVARAQRELGMVPADGPLPPVVVAAAPETGTRPLWQRLLAVVGAGHVITPVSAQEARP